jgi:hypothetical protein
LHAPSANWQKPPCPGHTLDAVHTLLQQSTAQLVQSSVPLLQTPSPHAHAPQSLAQLVQSSPLSQVPLPQVAATHLPAWATVVPARYA